MSVANPTHSKVLTHPEIESHVINIASNIPGKKGASLKALRHHAGLTLKQLGSRFHRRDSAVANWESEKSWPPGDMVLRVLETLSVPTEILIAHFKIELNADLDRRAYLAGDPDEIDYHYLLSKRGEVLQAMTIRATEGSDNAIKMFWERMDKMSALLGSRESKRERHLEPSSADDWTKRALPGAKPAAIDTTTSSKGASKDEGFIDPYSQVVESKEYGE